MEGCVTFWSVPALGGEGYESMLHLEDSFVLRVVTNTLEEHVWPTHHGQRMWAEDVIYDSPWEGRTRSCVVMENLGKAGKAGSHYEDLAADKVVGFRHEEGALRVFFKAHAEVVCVCAENGKRLLEIGVGGLVQLFNVKVSPQQVVFVTSTSGVRMIEREPPPVVPLSPPVPLGPCQKPEKWICITCNYVNHPGMSVCRGCDLQRKQGPLKGSAWNFRFDSVPRRQFKRLPQWMCKKCRYRDNFYIHDVCVKCGDVRKVEARKKDKRRKHDLE
jgi:hypothetical protein